MWRLIFIGLIIIIIITNYLINLIRQKIRDKAAKMILKDFNYEEEKNDILKINALIKEKHSYCPICSKPLNIKTWKHGQFIWCSAYPNCTFSSNI